VRDLRAQGRSAREEEYRRLLYVATTRAEERLYIMGYHGSKGRDRDCWHEMVERSLTPHMDEVPAPWGDGETLWRKVTGAPLEQAAAADASPPRPLEMPAWLTEPARPEAAPQPPLRPSSALAAADQFTIGDPSQGLRAHGAQAGRLMHELLQHALPGKTSRQALAEYIARRGRDLPDALQQALLRQAMDVMTHAELAPLFGPQGRAEVALAGRVDVNGREVPIIGRIDRLAETDAGVIIADFKTGSPPKSELPVSYVAQLALYRAAVARLYPARAVRALLVWTDGPHIVELDEETSARALASLH
jgi:ATP-dependent helicase/nuclease subunit A